LFSKSERFYSKYKSWGTSLPSPTVVALLKAAKSSQRQRISIFGHEVCNAVANFLEELHSHSPGGSSTCYDFSDKLVTLNSESSNIAGILGNLY